MQDFVSHDLKLAKTLKNRASERFVSSLRLFVLVDMATELRSDYEQTVVPQLKSSQQEIPEDGVGVHKALRNRDVFKRYSSLRCTAQEMVWRTAMEFVNPQAQALEDRCKELTVNAQKPLGSLTLNPNLEKPDYYDVVDVHLMPGNYDGVSAEASMLPGSLYDNGFNVFAMGVMGQEFNDIGWSMAKFVEHRFADLNPEVIIDVGCTIGHNTLPFKQTFPNAEVTGIDLSGSCLRYAHARAESMGIGAHFKQGRADALDFPDNSVDVVFSSMFLHELPLVHIQSFIKEAHRVLKPGGVLINMELPPNAALQPFDAFYLDWDCYYNNEPYYKNFRDQDFQTLCVDGGFSAKSFFQAVMPRYTYTEKEDFYAAIAGDAVFNEDTGRLSNVIEWYGFGARKE